MGILLMGISGATGEALIGRLVEESDEVRVIENDGGMARRWKALGARVANGSPADADLVERAAQDVRTIVVMDGGPEGFRDTIEAAIEGARAAARSIRLVVCGRVDDAAAGRVRDSGLEHVVLRTGSLREGRSPRRRRRVPRRAVVEAVDAADDLPGRPRLELDLKSADAWRSLRLAPPR